MAGFNLPTDALPAQRLAARGESLAAFDERCIPAPPQRGCRIGTPALAALHFLQILPVLPPHRANHARRGPRFSVVAPCRRGGAPNAAAALDPGRLARLGAAQTFTTGCSPMFVRRLVEAARDEDRSFGVLTIPLVRCG